MKTETQTQTYQLTASEFQWEISDGKTINAWGFNQSVPGPILRAWKGDTLVVKVKNDLKESTVIHWHGIQLPSAMDGTDAVQRPIALLICPKKCVQLNPWQIVTQASTER